MFVLHAPVRRHDDGVDSRSLRESFDQGEDFGPVFVAVKDLLVSIGDTVRAVGARKPSDFEALLLCDGMPGRGAVLGAAGARERKAMLFELREGFVDSARSLVERMVIRRRNDIEAASNQVRNQRLGVIERRVTTGRKRSSDRTFEVRIPDISQV
jgi:hypothetical protein